jgi:arylsulfatase A-like enzyme
MICWKSFSRQQYISVVIMSFLLMLSSAVCAASNKPNIVFIMADDLGYADVSAYGQQDYSTPHIDQLAAQGMKFTQAYANSAICSPSRTALITGRYQMRLPVGLEEPIGQGTAKNIGLPPEQPTLPSLLKKSGYGTALVGKWHLGFLPNFSPLKSGYESFYGTFGGGADYFNHGHQSKTRLFEGDTPVDNPGYMTDLLGDRAVKVIEGYAKSKQPFLLSLYFTAPHWPWEGPNDQAESKRINGVLKHYDGGSQKTYMAMMKSLDDNIGRVLRKLDESGLAKNTIVIFTSDNGGERYSNNWPFSGMKDELLEGGLRIPAIVRWPGKIKAGTVSQQVMISMDWMPTLLAAAGAEPDTTFPTDGENLLPTLTAKAPAHNRQLFWRFKAGQQRAVRDGDLKYLRIAGNEFLFDVVNDPRERANLKDRQKADFDRLKKNWENWNNTMLPERVQPAKMNNFGGVFADHYGVTNDE